MSKNNGRENLIPFLKSLQKESRSIQDHSYDLITQLFGLPMWFLMDNTDLILQARVAHFSAWQTAIEFYKVLEELQNADHAS
jgi:hypothetical protein